MSRHIPLFILGLLFFAITVHAAPDPPPKEEPLPKKAERLRAQTSSLQADLAEAISEHDRARTELDRRRTIADEREQVYKLEGGFLTDSNCAARISSTKPADKAKAFNIDRMVLCIS